MPEKRWLGPVLALLAVTVPPAPAGAVSVQTFTTSQSPFDVGVRNQGFWSPAIANNDSNASYIVQEGS